jgi:hypothetical protein
MGHGGGLSPLGQPNGGGRAIPMGKWGWLATTNCFPKNIVFLFLFFSRLLFF